jgi:membrane-associated protease RseP (regulator of RpoE activity)
MNGHDIASARPRLTRETRRLLMAALLAVVVLWVLAQVRFPDRQMSAGPISPLLDQLAPRSTFDDLAVELERLRTRVGPALVALPDVDSGDRRGRGRVGIRYDAVSAITQIDPRARLDPVSGLEVVARDRGTGLTVVRVGTTRLQSMPAWWMPERPDAPRYLAAAEMLHESVSLRPVFVSGLMPVTVAGWSGRIWRLPSGLDVPGGTPLFTGAGELAGLVVVTGGVAEITPADTLFADVRRLLEQEEGAVPGDLGISTRTLTPAVASATGVTRGVVVTRIADLAASRLAIGDVIDSIDGIPLSDSREWDVRVSRVTAGAAVDLSVWRDGVKRQVTVVAEAVRADGRPLGLVMRWVSGIGSEIVRVEPASAGEAAGLMKGDLITSIGESRSPTPSRIEQTFSRTTAGRPLVIGISRNDVDEVVALVKR